MLRRSGALIFLAADLDAATATAGERGYRDALIATGRHLAAMETAAATACLRLETRSGSTTARSTRSSSSTA